MPHPTSKSAASTSKATSSFVFFGGKGGVGKTTCAAARAVSAARSGKRVLLVSTDPAHSLGDALSVRLSFRPARVSVGRSNRGALSAVELDAPRAFARWLTQHRHALGEVLEHGTWLDRSDVDALLGLSIPGVDELVGMLEIVRLATAVAQPAFDLIVVDTAPTGHTLRLLASPDLVATVADVLDALQDEHRTIRARFASVTRPDLADRLIELLTRQARETRSLLRDPRRTAFHWVMLPEALSLAETTDAIAFLEAARLNVTTLVINRALGAGPRCPLCDRRRTEEQRVVAGARRTVARNRAIVVIKDLDREPRGVSLLAKLESRAIATSGIVKRKKRASVDLTARPAVAVGSRLKVRELDAARLVFFLGKGGTGKTTCAAATAVALAHARPDDRIHLLSLDPAHSLGDVFDTPIGDTPVSIDSRLANLSVRELDAAGALASRRAGIRAALDEVAGTIGSGLATVDGSRSISDLLELAPPGIDELFGLVSMMEALEARTFDVVVVDAAPTGHALRLLEMPEAAQSWIQVLIRLLLKYQKIVRPGRLAAELIDLSKSIRSLRRLLHSSDQARFIVITRAAAVPRRETERLLKELKRLHLTVSMIVSNAMTVSPGRCDRCRARVAEERRQFEPVARACRRAFRQCAIIQTPLVAPPPRGVAALERWSRQWLT